MSTTGDDYTPDEQPSTGPEVVPEPEPEPDDPQLEDEPWDKEDEDGGASQDVDRES